MSETLVSRHEARSYEDHLKLLRKDELEGEAREQIALSMVAGGRFHDRCALLLQECRRRGMLEIYGRAYEQAVAG